MRAAQEPQYTTSFLKNSQSHLVLLNVNQILTSTLLIFIFQFLFRSSGLFFFVMVVLSFLFHQSKFQVEFRSVCCGFYQNK